jgi:hypothetical protein
MKPSKHSWNFMTKLMLISKCPLTRTEQTDIIGGGKKCAFPYYDDLIPMSLIVIQLFTITMTEQTKNHLWKYNEDKILKEVEDYVTGTYHGHYCGDQDEYADIQTIDLMAAKKLAQVSVKQTS